MTSEKLNEKLFDCYSRVAKQIQIALDSRKGYSSPHFLSVPEGYLRSGIKLMIVGQQTYGWHQGVFSPTSTAVRTLMRCYDEFDLGKNYTRSPFWQGAHRLFNLLNANGPSRSFLWSNLIKVDKGQDRPEYDVEESICRLRILEQEISITKPDAVVFFTGPNYDQRLIDTFDGVEFSAHSPMLARLKHPLLPRQTYRTYHPNYLRRSRNWGVLEVIARGIQKG
jgi:hypothetical protein